MASLNELVELSNQGDLGDMLAKRFRGEIGSRYPRKDSELMIGFASKEATPSADNIGKAVTEHYCRLGYKVEPDQHQDQDAFEALIFFETKDRGLIHVNISTFYPLSFGDKHNHIRVTTSIFV